MLVTQEEIINLISKFQKWLRTGHYGEEGCNILRCVIAELEDVSINENKKSRKEKTEDLKEQIVEILDTVSENETYDDYWGFLQDIIEECSRRQEDILWEED